MTDPIVFQSVTSRHALPLLFAGQAQKEIVLNEALLRLDASTHCSVSGERSDPPASPGEGECWLIGADPTGLWEGRAGTIGCFVGGDWLFLQPWPGFRCFNTGSGQSMLFNSSWVAPPRPEQPSGGAVVDAEARQILTEILNALTQAGIFPD